MLEKVENFDDIFITTFKHRLTEDGVAFVKNVKVYEIKFYKTTDFYNWGIFFKVKETTKSHDDYGAIIKISFDDFKKQGYTEDDLYNITEKIRKTFKDFINGE